VLHRKKCIHDVYAVAKGSASDRSANPNKRAVQRATINSCTLGLRHRFGMTMKLAWLSSRIYFAKHL
jgi:hypothetical protein